MKQVKSKIMGCIGELDFDSKEGIFIVVCYDLYTKETVKSCYKSLEDLCEDWEDYEEPKEYWYIYGDGCLQSSHLTHTMQEEMKQIGNYFETEEEAELAVRKLKAWKRLKDKGFKFFGWGGIDITIHTTGLGRYIENGNLPNDILKDLDLLFGGEE